jgi:hypothetical protein
MVAGLFGVCVVYWGAFLLALAWEEALTIRHSKLPSGFFILLPEHTLVVREQKV